MRWSKEILSQEEAIDSLKIDLDLGTHPKLYNLALVWIIMLNKVILHCDGGSRGNPGPAAYGYVLFDQNYNVLEQKGGCIGKETNNVAEYNGLIYGLRAAAMHTNGEVEVRMDSELIVMQMQGKYKVKKEHLQKLFFEAKKIEKEFKKISYTHVYREDRNQQIADGLVNKALDER